LRQLYVYSDAAPEGLFRAEAKKHAEILKGLRTIQEQRKALLEKLQDKQKKFDEFLKSGSPRPLPPDLIVPPGLLEEVERAFKDGKAELDAHEEFYKKVKEAEEQYADRSPKLKIAKNRIDAIEKELKQTKGVFTVEAIVTNTGGRPISLLPTAHLLYLEKGNTGKAKMTIHPRNEPVIVAPNESKRVTLRSQRLDSPHQNDENRKRMQDRFGFSEKCQLEFYTSDGGTKKSDWLTFAEK
jgi:hypothetical protein